MENQKKIRHDPSDKDVWPEIQKSVEGLKYGTVLITVHDGKIVQVDTNTRTRFQ